LIFFCLIKKALKRAGKFVAAARFVVALTKRKMLSKKMF